MRNRIFVGIILLCAVVCINSCESKEALFPPGSGTGGGGGGGLPPGCDTTHLTYNGGIDSIINTQCAVSGCHIPRGGPGANNFQGYTNVTTETSGGKSSLFYCRLINTTCGATIMPNTPQPGWDECMKLKLEQWVLNGAPQ